MYSAEQEPVLSVCVSLKNRSLIMHKKRRLTLFPNCVRSLATAAPGIGQIELVVADYRSDDWPLEEWIHEAAGSLELRLITIEGDFSRGGGLNRAAVMARSNRLLLCDADVLLPLKMLRSGIEAVDRGEAYFPVCRHLDVNGRPGKLEHAGFGVVFVSRQVFELAGRIPEFTSWGGEDDVFRECVRELVDIKRNHVTGFCHQWHPERCRHEHYIRMRQCDYRAYRAASHPSVGRKPLKVFYGEHPRWRGEVHLFPGGRMARPGIDWGSYELQEGQRLTLKWDRWSPEVLEWDEEHGVYRDPTKAFSLRETR